MTSGLFGKLPAKRDFVSHNAPRRFLDVWEPWLQASVATSRQTMGSTWQDAFRSAPIWRFWLGPDLCGAAAAGAFMPSVDAVGRYFPLTVFALDDGTADIPPPEVDASDAWFEAVETVLLDALAPGADYDAVTAALAALPSLQAADPEPFPGIVPLAEGPILLRGYGDGLPTALKAARRLHHRRGFSGQTFWWTVGGESFPPAALAAAGLPPATLFEAMLTARFAESVADRPVEAP